MGLTYRDGQPVQQWDVVQVGGRKFVVDYIPGIGMTVRASMMHEPTVLQIDPQSSDVELVERGR